MQFFKTHQRIAEHGRAISLLPAILDLTYEPAVKMILYAFGSGKKLLTCGNGGSHAQASHLATELTVRFETDRRALPAICVSGDATALTATGNDYGYHRTLSRQVEALGTAGDVLVAFST
ncbi:MAG: SIS domain-containing protein, partial [Verrucomicrobiota bacterium]